MALRRTARFVMAAAAAVLGLGSVLAACGGDDGGGPAGEDGAAATSTAVTSPASSTTEGADTPSGDRAGAAEGEMYPDVLDASATLGPDGTWRVEATLSSPYDSPERYADAWRVTGPDGTVFGVRELVHDHAAEQPFTRSLTGVEIPDDVDTVTVQGRDQVSGWGGATVEVDLQRG